MLPSSRAGRALAVLLAGLALTACTSTTTPITGSGAPPSVAILAPSASPEGSQEPTASPAPTAVVTAGAELGPTNEPTDVPQATPDPTPFPNPTTRPTSAPAASCGTGEAGFAAADKGPRTLQFGGATIEFTGAGVALLDGSWNSDDVIPGGIGLTRNEIAVVVGPSAGIVLRAKDLTLLGTTAAASPWSKVTFNGGLADLGGPKTTLPWRFRQDGSLSIAAPDRIGDWAIAFLPIWEGACTSGDGVAYARIKVK